MEGLRKNEKKREKIYCFFRSVLIYCFFPSVPLSATAFILREEIFFSRGVATNKEGHQEGRRKSQPRVADFFFFDKKVAALLLYQKKRESTRGILGTTKRPRREGRASPPFPPFALSVLQPPKSPPASQHVGVIRYPLSTSCQESGLVELCPAIIGAWPPSRVLHSPEPAAG